MPTTDILLRTKYDPKGFRKLENQADQSTKKGGSLGKLKFAMAGLGLAAVAGTAVAAKELAQFAGESITLAKEQLRVEEQLNAVIESTGGAAGLTAAEVKGMASSFQDITNFGDEVTLTGQNLLLTYTNIGENVFPRATGSMLDMATAMDEDVTASATRLGKALNDPVAGVGALSEAGVQFTDKQKTLIESLVEMGDVAGAQAVILGELETQFAGSAEAARKADGGSIAFKNTLGDIQESLATPFLPLLNEGFAELSEILTDAAPLFKDFATSAAEKLGPIAGNIAIAMRDLGVAFGVISGEGDSTTQAVDGVAAGLDLIVQGLEGIRKGTRFVRDLAAAFRATDEAVEDASGGLISISENIANVAKVGALSPIETIRKGVGLLGFQHGGSFKVGGSGGPDSQLVQFKASPDEQVTISPPSQTQSSAAAAVNNSIAIDIPINISGSQLDESAIRGVAESHVQALVLDIEEMLAN